MLLTIELADDAGKLKTLAPEWDALARASGDGALFRGPSWLIPWWQHFGAALEATLHVVAVREAGALIGLAPFYTRAAKVVPGLKAHELRLLGDAGPRPPALDLLCLAGAEARVAQALVQHLLGPSAPVWDVIDLAPLRDPSRLRAHLAEKLDGAGRKVDTQDAGSTLALALLSGSPIEVSPDVKLCGQDRAAVDKCLAAMRALSRLEWAHVGEASPLADVEATRLLGDVALDRGARLTLIDGEHGEPSAVALVIDDSPRAICLAHAADPDRAGLTARLVAEAASAAMARGRAALDVVMGASDFETPGVPSTRRRSLRLRAFNATAAGTVARTYASFRRHAGVAPGAAAAGARAAWTRIREAAAQVASYQRLHLYRGQLWTRGVRPPEGLACAELTEAAFDDRSPNDRGVLVERLELDEGYCREKWRRGDLAVIASLVGRPAGIAWCARNAVSVAEIGREVRPGPLECYIHDVYVAPDARGKNVAPALLEDLARRLRQRDVYRAWALIEPSNVASTRAFEKAAYVAVADVIHARMAVVDKLVIRPPDPEAKRLLGL